MKQSMEKEYTGKLIFIGDEITSIYKNGKRIPDDLVDDYKHKVYEELDEMRYGGDHFSFRMPAIYGEEFNFDMEEFQKEMEEIEIKSSQT